VSAYVILDLKQLVDQLGDHYEPTMRDEYQSPCPNCGEQVPQTVCECPVCGIKVIWRNSPAWRARFGNPNTMEQLLNQVPPKDPAGQELIRLARLNGFANQFEADRWARAVRKIGGARAMGIVRYAQQKKQYTGRALLAYTLAIVEKAARSVSEQREPGPPPAKKPTVVTI